MLVSLRPANPNDEEFLGELYSSTRREELASWGWDAVQRDAFLTLQFNAQQAHFRTRYPEADHSIVLVDGRPMGRMVVVRTEQEIRLADIALLPECRSAGVGTSLIRDLHAEGTETGRPVRLHVSKTNRAQELYTRLGFTKVGDTGTHFVMEWAADEQ